MSLQGFRSNQSFRSLDERAREKYLIIHRGPASWIFPKIMGQSDIIRIISFWSITFVKIGALCLYVQSCCKMIHVFNILGPDVIAILLRRLFCIR